MYLVADILMCEVHSDHEGHMWAIGDSWRVRLLYVDNSRRSGYRRYRDERCRLDTLSIKTIKKRQAR